MEQKKNLCAQIPLSLHAQVCEARETAGQTMSRQIGGSIEKTIAPPQRAAPSRREAER